MIGVFDSGSGGLTVLQALRAQAPNVDLLYVGDLLNAPYGNKDLRDLEQLTFQMIRFLRSQGTTHLVSACNSISAAVIRPMLDLFNVQVAGITEMVGPTADALRSFEQKRIVIFTTEATRRSNMYQRACAERGLEVYVVALPKLAGYIEFNAPTEMLIAEINSGIQEVNRINADMIVFGCTHFPLVRHLFEQQASAISSSINIFDPASAVALQAITLHGAQGTGKTDILITRESDQCRRFAVDRGFQPTDIRVVSIKNVDHTLGNP